MPHLIPARVHRWVLRIVHGLRVHWWRWRRSKLVDCRVVAIDTRGRVLLVRHSYGSGVWMLPGGGPRSGEEPLATAARELREETGCILEGAIEVAAPDQTANPVAYVVVGRTSGTPRADRREIIEAAFFAPDALPEPTSRALASRLPEWLDAYRASAGA
ncbi:MAG: NUDIX domain-containing protein [Novosphingobium sp.]